jgi:hypothetical protein
MPILIFAALCIGWFVGVASFSYSENYKFNKELREACEKDLARNLKCEMVYVKPEGE